MDEPWLQRMLEGGETSLAALVDYAVQRWSIPEEGWAPRKILRTMLVGEPDRELLKVDFVRGRPDDTCVGRLRAAGQERAVHAESLRSQPIPMRLGPEDTIAAEAARTHPIRETLRHRITLRDGDAIVAELERTAKSSSWTFSFQDRPELSLYTQAGRVEVRDLELCPWVILRPELRPAEVMRGVDLRIQIDSRRQGPDLAWLAGLALVAKWVE